MSTIYGDISPRTAAYASAKMLDRALPAMCMSRFGQMHPIPKNKSNAIKLRRYNGFAPSLTALVEGVTPAPDTITNTDVMATLAQYGRRVQISDVILDTHEDPVLNEYSEVLGEVAGQTSELVIYNAIRAGTNILYSGTSNTLRTGCNSAITSAVLDKAIRQLNRQNAKPITRVLAGTDKVGTTPIRPAFMAFCHPDMQQALEGVLGAAFINPANYPASQPALPQELGSYKNIRFMGSTLYSPFFQAASVTGSGSTYMTGGAGGGATGFPDVYPIVIVGENAYGSVTLAGENAIHPIVINPKPSDSDVMAQRAHVAFKMYAAALILNDAYMVRVETLVAQ